MGSSNSLRINTANTPIMPPKVRLPVSAHEHLLPGRHVPQGKPTHAPTNADAKTVNSSPRDIHDVQVRGEVDPPRHVGQYPQGHPNDGREPDASPSSPSVRFALFDTAVTIKDHHQYKITPLPMSALSPIQADQPLVVEVIVLHERDGRRGTFHVTRLVGPPLQSRY